MGTIKYKIVSGKSPFRVELTPSSILPITHNGIGNYEISDVPNGGYTLKITDSNGCVFEREITVDPNITTSTTTIAPSNSIVIGNTQDEILIFNTNGTNRDSHYSGYPNPNDVTLYLWFKTLNGKPITTQQLLSYNFNALGSSTFRYLELSNQIYAEVFEGIGGPSSLINGDIILKPGFIETYFKYTYTKDSTSPDYTITLESPEDIFYESIPLVGGLNSYGVTNVNRRNITMEF